MMMFILWGENREDGSARTSKRDLGSKELRQEMVEMIEEESEEDSLVGESTGNEEAGRRRRQQQQQLVCVPPLTWNDDSMNGPFVVNIGDRFNKLLALM
jgi:hypothetical protein